MSDPMEEGALARKHVQFVLTASKFTQQTGQRTSVGKIPPPGGVLSFIVFVFTHTQHRV